MNGWQKRPVFVVSIPRRAESLEMVKDTWADTGIGLKVWPGVDGLEDFEFRPDESLASQFVDAYKNGLVDAHRKGTDSEIACVIACYLSHYRLWQYCLKQGYERVLVIEDDAFPDNISKKLWDELWSLPLSCEYINLCPTDTGNLNQFKKAAKMFGVLKWFMPFCKFNLQDAFASHQLLYGTYALCRLPVLVAGAVAYIVTQEGMEKLCRHAMPISKTVDGFIGSFWVSGLKHFSLFPSALKHMGSKSAIVSHSSHQSDMQAISAYDENLVSEKRNKMMQLKYVLVHRQNFTPTRSGVNYIAIISLFNDSQTLCERDQKNDMFF